MGWVFIALGLLLIGFGSFLTYYGQQLLTSSPAVPTHANEIVLSPRQEKLLGLLADYQRKYAVEKLVVVRKGYLHFDKESPQRDLKINILSDLFGTKVGDNSRQKEFELMMEQLPDRYLRRLPETRFDNPFVVSVTENGMRYLRKK